MSRVLIADDHGLYRRGLRAVLEGFLLSDVEIIEASCIDSALARLEEPAKIDLALVDLNMNGTLSLGILKEVRDIYPDTRFVIISASEARSDVFRALHAGLHGFISKSQSDEEIVSAISDVLSGRIYVPPLLLRIKDTGPDGEAVQLLAPEPIALNSGPVEMQKLTPRQRDVVTLIADGLSNKEIARALKIAEATTKIHVAALMRALGVRNRTEAALRVKSWLSEQGRSHL